MRASEYLIATVKETPTDAETPSHQLMLRAGLIRKLASGLYTWLPLGLRVLHKVSQIVREEMDRAGAMEVSMPIVQHAELWEESGRWLNIVVINNYLLISTKFKQSSEMSGDPDLA